MRGARCARRLADTVNDFENSDVPKRRGRINARIGNLRAENATLGEFVTALVLLHRPTRILAKIIAAVAFLALTGVVAKPMVHCPPHTALIVAAPAEGECVLDPGSPTQPLALVAVLLWALVLTLIMYFEHLVFALFAREARASRGSREQR